MTDASILFRNVLQGVYGQLDWLPVADGAIHRFHIPNDKPGTVNGWYVLYWDGIASAAFGNWKAGGKSTWCNRESAEPRSVERLRQHIEQSRQQRTTAQLSRQQATAEVAQRWWVNAPHADPDHRYLIVKAVQPYGLRQRGGHLLVPLYVSGHLVNLQRIAHDGSKRFLSGGQVNASYSPLGRITPSRPLYICEGWATGATLHRGGCTVAVAMNAGNLKSVALSLRVKYPDIEIIIAGDDDRQTRGNPGRAAATDAANASGARVSFPDWPAGSPDHLTDFNDLHTWRATQ